MTSYKLVWICGIPRTGSMWTYNVVKSLVRKADLIASPNAAPKLDKDKRRVAAEILDRNIESERGVIKTHEKIPEALIPSSFFVVTHRDPRDSIMSYMRFQACSFDVALKTYSDSRVAETYFQSLPREQTIHVHYPTIINEPDTVARTLATALGVTVSEDDINQIVGEYSKHNVRKIIDAAAENPLNEESTVYLQNGDYRVRDLKTGFQTSHVSDYKDGDWRGLLSGQQKKKMNATLEPWLRHMGYDCDG